MAFFSLEMFVINGRKKILMAQHKSSHGSLININQKLCHVPT